MDVEFFFAWVDPPGTAGPEFDSSYARSDEIVLGFDFEHQEGEFATLEVTAKGRGVALLSASRKTWAWFSIQRGTDLTPLFFGRLTGIQTVRSEDGPVMVLNLTAEPIDYLVQKKAIADSLRVLPRWDPAFIDAQSRDDDDLVLDAYPLRWHIDPVTHVVSTSNELIGEDGVISFALGETLQNNFSVDLTTVPASSVTVSAAIKWTQKATGQVALQPPSFQSYTFAVQDWPQVGATIGSGWTAAASSCADAYDQTVRSRSYSNTVNEKPGSEWVDTNTGAAAGSEFGGSDLISSTISGSDDEIDAPGISFPAISTSVSTNVTYGPGDTWMGITGTEVTSYSYSAQWVTGIVPLHKLTPSLIGAYAAARPFIENVSFTLVADIQPVIGDPDSSRALDPITLSTSDLSNNLDDDTTSENSPIGDPRRRSYIVTDRGLQSLQYMIALGQTALLTASRCIQISFAPVDFSSVVTASLRNNARIARAELPGGTAEGKIVGRSIAMQRNSGRIDASLTIASAPGHGGEIEQVDGTPTYVEAGYVDADYQEETDGTELFDSSVGYTPPLFAPNDDGLDFIAGFSGADAVDQAFAISNAASAQEDAIRSSSISGWLSGFGAGTNGISLDDPTQTIGDEMVTQRAIAVNNVLDTIKTTVSFKLKSMTREFSTDIPITVTALKVPTMIDLEAA